jgi:hypothetical protein
MGKFFVYWVIVFFWAAFENYRSSPFWWATFFSGKSKELISTKMDWATIWAIFFSGSSGHPERNLPVKPLFQ